MQAPTSFKVALRRCLNTNSFYSVNDFFLCLRMIYEAVGLQEILTIFCVVIIAYIVHIFMWCVLMTYSTSYCHFYQLWIHGIYVCIHLCIAQFTYQAVCCTTERQMQFQVSSRPAFLKLWSADHKWSSGSALVVLLD